MESSLQSRFDRMERRRAAVLEDLRPLSPAQLAFRPAPEAWSLQQVVEHLVIAEEGTVAGLRKGPPPHPTVRLRARASLKVIYLVFRLGLKVKVPDGGQRLKPAGEADLAQLADRWAAARRGLAEQLEALGSADLAGPRFRHPLAGWLSIVDGLEFLDRHIAHHQRQMRRIRRAAGLPV